jgi:hypothetical protein
MLPEWSTLIYKFGNISHPQVNFYIDISTINHYFFMTISVIDVESQGRWNV